MPPRDESRFYGEYVQHVQQDDWGRFDADYKKKQQQTLKTVILFLLAGILALLYVKEGLPDFHFGDSTTPSGGNSHGGTKVTHVNGTVLHGTLLGDGGQVVWGQRSTASTGIPEPVKNGFTCCQLYCLVSLLLQLQVCFCPADFFSGAGKVQNFIGLPFLVPTAWAWTFPLCFFQFSCWPCPIFFPLMSAKPCWKKPGCVWCGCCCQNPCWFPRSIWTASEVKKRPIDFDDRVVYPGQVVTQTTVVHHGPGPHPAVYHHGHAPPVHYQQVRRVHLDEFIFKAPHDKPSADFTEYVTQEPGFLSSANMLKVAGRPSQNECDDCCEGVFTECGQIMCGGETGNLRTHCRDDCSYKRFWTSRGMLPPDHWHFQVAGGPMVGRAFDENLDAEL